MPNVVKVPGDTFSCEDRLKDQTQCQYNNARMHMVGQARCSRPALTGAWRIMCAQLCYCFGRARSILCAEFRPLVSKKIFKDVGCETTGPYDSGGSAGTAGVV